MHTPSLNSQIIVHSTRKVFSPFEGMQTYCIEFLCPVRGIVQIYREIPIADNEWDQAALVRAEISKYRNS